MSNPIPAMQRAIKACFDQHGSMVTALLVAQALREVYGANFVIKCDVNGDCTVEREEEKK